MAVVTRRVHSLTPLASFDPGGSMSEIDSMTMSAPRPGKVGGAKPTNRLGQGSLT